MPKIGLFLRSVPFQGGGFQYSQAILDATLSLSESDENISVIILYTHEGWSKILEGYADIRAIYRPEMLWDQFLRLIWRLFDISTWRKIFPYFHPLAKTILKERCDLWIFPCSEEWSYKFPVPSLVSIHDLMHRYERRFPEVGSNREFRGRDQSFLNICKWAKGILVDSAIGEKHVVESYGLASDKIHVLPYVAPRYMHSDTVEDFDSIYNLPEKFLFYPAQFWEHKNHKGLIKAIHKLRKELPDIKIVFSGSKSNGFSSIYKLKADLQLFENVIFLGYVPDGHMPYIYRRARALIMPTFFGPTNIPPLEAFVAGCPVAVSNIYGMPEQVGDSALLFNPESIDQIAESVRRLWTDDDLCSELAKKGKKRATHWGPNQFAHTLKEIIEQILNESTSRNRL